MWIDGIDGPSKLKDREKSFEVLSFEHEVTAPFEARSGEVTGQRVHHPLKVLKTVDEGSPKLYKAIKKKEHLTVEIKWYRPAPEGSKPMQHYFTTKLENAKLVSIKPQVPNVNETAHSGTGHLEELSFVYDTITWTFQGGGAQKDKWTEPD